MSFPDGRSKWQVPLFKIQTLLEQEGYSVVSPKTAMITFQRESKDLYPKLRQMIAATYREHYPTMRIHNVTLQPTSSTMKAFQYSPQCRFRLTKSNLRKKRGTFVVVCGKKHYYFQYEINASITLYKASHQIKKDKIIDSKSVHRVTVPFNKMNDRPVVNISEEKRMAKQNISEGRIITSKMVQPIPEVRKNERVLCIYHDGPVTIEFEAMALQNGYMGDNITVKKTNGISIRGVVVGKKTVEIR